MTELGDLTPHEQERVRKCEKEIGYRFKNSRLLLQALTHSSTQGGGGLFSNERLEFLGDSVLGLAVSEFLYNFLENCNEGELTQIKSVVVSTTVLAARSLCSAMYARRASRSARAFSDQRMGIR